jgi:mono/diheme cytochrome c family protein
LRDTGKLYRMTSLTHESQSPGIAIVPRLTFISLCLFVLFPLALPAQQLPASDTRNKIQTSGRRIFQQRCGVCHTAPTITSGVYGPILYKEIVDGNEDPMRQFIRNGSRRMPGFKYGLEPSEIDAVIAYLKTVPKPEKNNSPEGKDRGPID